MGSTVRSGSEESSGTIRARVCEARAVQRARFAGPKLNRQLEGSELREHCAVDEVSTALLDTAIQRFCLSARGYDRVLRVGRTVADLSGAARIEAEHLAEALQYRFTFS